MPHLCSVGHPHLQRGDAGPQEHQGWWLLPREGSGGGSRCSPRSGGGSCCSPGFPAPASSCLQAQCLANQTPQLLARANLPRAGAPGRHQKPDGSTGMGREQQLFLLEQRGVSPLGCSCPEGEVGGCHVNAFERFVVIYFLFC